MESRPLILMCAISSVLFIALTHLKMLHMSADNAGHQRLGPLEKLQQKFGNVLKGNHTVTNFRGEYTGKVALSYCCWRLLLLEGHQHSISLG